MMADLIMLIILQISICYSQSPPSDNTTDIWYFKDMCVYLLYLKNTKISQKKHTFEEICNCCVWKRAGKAGESRGRRCRLQLLIAAVVEIKSSIRECVLITSTACRLIIITCVQILGWSLIIISALVGFLGTCCKNCRSKVSYLQLTFWKRYIEKEKERFDALSVEYAKKLAERNLESFFENKHAAAFPFPNHKAWEEISAYYTFSQSEQYYSTLQRYVEKTDRDFNPEKRPVLDSAYGIEMS